MENDLKARFEKASQEVKTLQARPSNDTLLELYAFYKQATEGDAKGERPGFLDPKGRAKFDAWTKKKGTSAEQAMEKYVGLVSSLVGH